MLQLCTLRRFQLAGHRPISLAGGGTGLIGDPGGKQDERALLTREVLDSYLEGIRPQLAQFLDLSDALLLDNSAWLGQLSTLDFLRDVGKHFTVNQMVGKESVKTRFERPDQGISYTEFSYMLLQAYDFLRLHLDHGCDLQIGGSDQWGNITLGVELVRKSCGDEVWGLTTPLVLKADGTKLGKSESGNVWLSPGRTSPFALYQFFLNSADAMVGAYLRFFTFLSHEEIEALDAETAAHPERRAAQRALAREVVALVHGEARGGQVRRGVGRALRRGDRRTSARRCCWRSPRTPPPPRSAGSRFSTACPSSTRWSRVAWPSREATPDGPSRAGAPTSTTCSSPTSVARSGPTISSMTATSCCARGLGASTSCAQRGVRSGGAAAPYPVRRARRSFSGSAPHRVPVRTRGDRRPISVSAWVDSTGLRRGHRHPWWPTTRASPRR